MTTWDANFEAQPADSDAANDGANQIRILKAAVSNRLELEMNFKAGTQPLLKAGIAAVCYSGNTADIGALANMSAGAVAYNTTTGFMQRYSGAAWANLTPSAFATGTKALFYQSAAPTFWTLDANINDKVITVTNDANDAGKTGGSWTISGITVANHTLTVDEIPAHGHDMRFGTWQPYGTGSFGALWSVSAGNTNSSNTGGGGGHNHTLSIDGLWRPAYAAVLIATKN